VNERLLSEPHLASDAPTQEGFLAILMPRPEDVQKLRKLALSPEEYRALRSVDEQ
jgi:glycine cleavage system H lipoate-binding protein